MWSSLYLGAQIREYIATLLRAGQVTQPGDLLYAETPTGFRCRSCRYATPVNAHHGRCAVLPGTVHLDDGCCVAWDYAPALLQVKEL